MAHTLEVNGRVGIGLSRGSHGVVYAIIVIVAIDVIAIFVDEGWVSVDYGASVSGMFDLLNRRLAQRHSLHIFIESLSVPVCRRRARSEGPVCPREQIWHSASTCCRDWWVPGFRSRNRILVASA